MASLFGFILKLWKSARFSSPTRVCGHPRDQDLSGFFIGKLECIVCGVCHKEAPENVRWNTPWTDDDDFGSYIYRQPADADQLEALICAIECCPVDCFYYGGDDPSVIKKLSERDLGFCIQKPIWDQLNL